MGEALLNSKELYEDHKLREGKDGSTEGGYSFLNPHYRMRKDFTTTLKQDLANDSRCAPLRTLGDLLTQFGSSLGKQLKEQLNLPLECISDVQLSYYPGNDSRYTLHLDNPGKANGRDTYMQLTCLYILAPQDWLPEAHGGYIRLTIPKDLENSPKTVEEALEIEDDLKVPPIGDTLVILRSDKIWWDLSFVKRDGLACLGFFLMSKPPPED